MDAYDPAGERLEDKGPEVAHPTAEGSLGYPEVLERLDSRVIGAVADQVAQRLSDQRAVYVRGDWEMTGDRGGF